MAMTYADLKNRVEWAGQEEFQNRILTYRSSAREKLALLEKTLGEDLIGVLEKRTYYNFYEDGSGHFALTWSGAPVELKVFCGLSGCVEAYWYAMHGSGPYRPHREITERNFCKVFAEIERNGVDPDDYKVPTYMGLQGSEAQEAIMGHLAGTNLTGTTLQRIHQLMEMEEATRDIFVNLFNIEVVKPQLVALSEVRTWEVIKNSTPF